MHKYCKLFLAFIMLITLFLSGCNFFSGQYQPSKATPPGPNEQATDFSVADKILSERLEDIGSGNAKPGEPAPGSSGSSGSDTAQPPASDNTNNMPKVVIDKSKNYWAVLKTGQGDITIALAAAKTPVTVNNFVYLAASKFYDNTVFHRVINGFMIQGGDPKGDGTGDPGYRFADEPFEGDYTRGTVAMANSGPNTNGSQFFIVQKDSQLQKNYVIFGQVVAGMDVVDKIAGAPVEANTGGENSKPVNPVKIQSVEIIEK